MACISRAFANLGESESTLSSKHVRLQQTEEKRVGNVYRISICRYNSKAGDYEKGDPTKGGRPLFILNATLINGRSQHEEYDFRYSRPVDERDINALLDQNGGRTRWKKIEDMSWTSRGWKDTSSLDKREKKWKQVWNRDDKKATLIATERSLTIFSDEYLKVEEIQKHRIVPKF